MAEIKYSNFFELSNQAMFVVDMDGYILKINDCLANLLGYTKKELLHTKFWDYLFENDKEITEVESDKVISGKISKSFVNRYKSKNGTLVYFEWNSYPDLENNLTYAVGKDITNYLFNDSLLQDIAQNIPGTIFKLIKSENGTYEFAFSNQKDLNIFNEMKSKYTFNNFLETLSTESQLLTIKELEKAERDLKFKSFNIYLSNNGQTTYQININPIKEGRIVVFYGTSTKISENYIQKPLDKIKLKNAIINNDQGYFALNLNNFYINSNFNDKYESYLDARIIDCNELFSAVYGFEKEEIINKTIREIYPVLDDVKLFLEKLINNNYSLINNISYDSINNIYYSTTISCIIEDSCLVQLIGYFEDVSLQLYRQKQLEISNSNHRQIFENSPIGLMIHDESKVLHLNNQALELLEATYSEIIGSNPFDLVYEDYLNDIKVRFDNIFINKNDYNLPKEIKIKTLKGNIIDVQVAGHSIIYDNKRCLEVSFVNITERVKLQKENEYYKNLYQSVLDNTTEFIIRMDINGVFTYCNKTYLDRIGYELEGKHLSYCLADGQIELLEELINKIKNNPNEKYNIVLAKTDVNNKKLLVNWDIIAIQDKNEFVIQCLGHDVTELEKTKLNLELANQRLNESAQLAKLAYWEFNPNTGEVIWDDNLFQMLGYEVDKIITYDFSRNIVHPDDLNEFDKAFNKATNFYKVVYYEYRLKKRNGEYIYVNGNMKPIFDNQNNISKVVASLQDVTETKLKEKEILFNRNIYEAIFKSLPLGLNLQDKNDRIIMHNKEAERILGLTEGQLLGKDSLDPRWKAENEFGKMLESDEIPSKFTLRTGKPVRNFLMKVSKGDDSYTWILINTEPASFSENGDVETVIVSFLDVTEIKEVNSKLESSFILLNEMGSLAKTGAWEYNIIKDELYWSDSMYEIYALDKSYEPINEVEARFYSEEEFEIVKKDFTDLTENGKELDAKYRFIDAKGNKKVIRFKAKFVNNSRESNKIIGITQDITDLTSFEEEIANKNISLQQLKNAIDKSSIVSYTNVKGKFIEVNEKFVEVYGFTREEIIAKDHKILSSNVHSKEFWKEFWDTLLEGNIWTGEICNKTKNGKLLWFYATILPLKDSNGRILNFLEILIDITLSKKYEKELEETVNSRTKELNETIIEKDFILQMVSHDLKNPLTGIVLQTELMRLLSKKKEYLSFDEKIDYILECTQRMNLIINNLLEFDSLHKDNNLLFKEVDINLLLLELSKNYKNKLDKKNQELIIFNPNKNLTVLSHKNHLYQILENLLSNASKFSNLGSKIEIFIENRDEKVNILIKDYGPGISENELEKLFDKFVKLSNKPTGDEISSGLGLAIVKKLCELLNHEIQVESKVNIGTIFTIILKSF